MLNIFKFKKNGLIKLDIYKKNKTTKTKKYNWIDLINPSNQERDYVQKKLKQKIITKQKLFNIEESARFFLDKDGIHIHSFFFYKDKKNYLYIYTVAFIINKKKIYTLREIELTPFRLYRIKNKNKKNMDHNPYRLIINLFKIKIEQIANEIENIYKDLEDLTNIILKEQDIKEFNSSILILSKKEDTTSKTRICLIDTQRALFYLIRENLLEYRQREKSREILRDIESLLTHNEYIFQKIDFLMQSAINFLNIEQNKIIKIFSIMSIIFLPPSLIASTYGMNFKHTPELNWHYGYPITIITMFGISLMTYLYFKIKKWL